LLRFQSIASLYFDCATPLPAVFEEGIFMWHDLLGLFMWRDLWTDKDVRDIALHALVVLMSMAVFFGGILIGLFYAFKSAYARLRHMRLEQ
jgi:hypothetical protein